MPMFKRIVLAYDGSEHATTALRRAAALARLCDAELHLLGIVVTVGSAALAEAYAGIDIFSMEHRSIEQALKDAVNDLDERVSVHTRIREGNPAEQIAAYAREVGADLTVIGHGRKDLLARWFEGSTGAKLIRDLPCDLLVASG
jgi:nucleotide-binding universal stress UspA family protein